MFYFNHADIQNSFYNPEGRLRPETYQFPYEDAAFNIIYAVSPSLESFPLCALCVFARDIAIFGCGFAALHGEKEFGLLNAVALRGSETHRNRLLRMKVVVVDSEQNTWDTFIESMLMRVLITGFAEENYHEQFPHACCSMHFVL